MAISSTKSTVLAIVKETTEGTLKLPSSGTDFAPITASLEITPNIESLENEEIRGSIGKSKSISGIEAPEASLELYLKHSGVEGQAPSYSEVIEGAFGSTSVQATERTTTTGSTASVLKLASGGSDYSRGKAVLYKGATYVIRPVHSVSSNDLTLGFEMTAALTGGGCGKFVNFSPANSGHPSVSLHRYNGNEHSIESMSGGKVTEMSLSVEAGELIKGSYSLVGTKYFFDPIHILAADVSLDFDDGGVKVATLTAQSFKTPHALASSLQTAMNAVSSGVTVSYSNTTGKFTIVKASGTLELLAATGANLATSAYDKLGFAATDLTGALTYTSDAAQSWVAPYVISLDNANPLVAASNEVFLGNASDNVNFCAASLEISFTNENSQVKCVSAEGGVDANFFSGREVKITVSGKMDKHDAGLIDRFLNNSDSRFSYSAGEKSGGNWVPGKCVNVYIPTCSVTSYSVVDLDSVVGVDIELTGFVDSSGNGECYINFL